MWLRRFLKAIFVPAFRMFKSAFPKLAERFINVIQYIVYNRRNLYGLRKYIVKFERKFKSYLQRKVTNYKDGPHTYTGEVYGYIFPQRNGHGVVTFSDGTKYEGEFKDDHAVINRPKVVKPNDRRTEVFMSKTIANENRADEVQYGVGRFDGGEAINRHTVSTAEEFLAQLEQLQVVSKEHSGKIRIVFNQHGDVNGWNDIKITQVHAKQALEILENKGYKDVVISDLACHGGTAFHFHKVAQKFVDSTGVKLRINSSCEGLLVYDAVRPDLDGNTMATFPMRDKSYGAKPRLKKTYTKDKSPQSETRM